MNILKKLFGSKATLVNNPLMSGLATEGQKLANLILANPVIRAEVAGTINFLESQALKGIEKLEKAAEATIPTIASHIPVLGTVSKSVAILVVQTVYNDVKVGILAEVKRLLKALGL